MYGLKKETDFFQVYSHAVFDLIRLYVCSHVRVYVMLCNVCAVGRSVGRLVVIFCAAYLMWHSFFVVQYTTFRHNDAAHSRKVNTKNSTTGH